MYISAVGENGKKKKKGVWGSLWGYVEGEAWVSLQLHFTKLNVHLLDLVNSVMNKEVEESKYTKNVSVHSTVVALAQLGELKPQKANTIWQQLGLQEEGGKKNHQQSMHL